MMKLVGHPNVMLKTRSTPVPVSATDNDGRVVFEEPIGHLLAFMRDVLDKTGAIGIAANQVNVPRRVFLMRGFTTRGDPNGDLHFQPRDTVLTVINPVILKRSPELCIFVEGCLSFPGKQVKTRRPASIEVGFFDENGQSFIAVMDGLEAIIFQHEFDHLNGRVMKDREFTGRTR